MVYRTKTADGSTRLTGMGGMGDDRMRLLQNYALSGIVNSPKVSGSAAAAYIGFFKIAFPQLAKKAGAYGNDNFFGWGDEISMPADGTVIPGHNGAPSITVSGGMIGPIGSSAGVLTTSLYYEMPWDGRSGSFHHVGSGGASGAATDFTPPAHWLLVFSVAPLYGATWGFLSQGRANFLITPSYGANVIAYDGLGVGYSDPSFIVIDGECKLQGLIKTTAALAANAVLLSGLPAPADGLQHIMWSLISSNTAMGRIDINGSGQLTTAAALASGAWISLENIRYLV